MSKSKSKYIRSKLRRKQNLQSEFIGAPLVDDIKVTRNGEHGYKSRQWKPRKMEAENILKDYRDIGGAYEKIADRMESCASWLVFGQWEKGQQKTNKLRSACFCKVRMCPMCQWRRSRKLYSQVADIAGTYKELHKSHRALLLTLTIPNVQVEEAREGVGRLIDGFRKMTNSRKWKGFVKAAFRTIEVTYNDEADTLHPHMHVLLMVSHGYFQRDRGKYLTQADWQSWWSECVGAEAGQEYLVDIRSVKHQHGNDAAGALAEVTKYCVKPEGIYSKYDENGQKDESFRVGPRVLKALHDAFHGRRLVMFYGEFRTIKNDKKLEDIEGDGVDLGTADDAVKEGLDHPEYGEYVGDLAFGWGSNQTGQKNYYLRKVTKKKES